LKTNKKENFSCNNNKSAKELLRSSSSPAYFRDYSTCNIEASSSYLFLDNLIRNAKNPCLDLPVSHTDSPQNKSNYRLIGSCTRIIKKQSEPDLLHALPQTACLPV